MMIDSLSERFRMLRALPRPLSEDLPPQRLDSPQVSELGRGRPLFGVVPMDVPLLVIPDRRVEFDYGEHVERCHYPPFDQLSLLASTQSGFQPATAPDYRFPGALSECVRLCEEGSIVYSGEDARGFRSWLHQEIQRAVVPSADAGDLVQQAISLPLPRQEMLMVPLNYLNHMWRQGSPVAAPAAGHSALPAPFDALLSALSTSTGILPRFNQLTMTMRAWRIDGVPDGDPVTYRDLTDLQRVWPRFWLNGTTGTELNFYRAFFAVESFGIPVYGWGTLARECAAAADAKLGAQALRCVHAALRNIYFCVRHLVPSVDPAEFRKMQLTGEWVNGELNGGASGYQLPFSQMMDALFNVKFTHPGATEARNNAMRFVPKRWQDFFSSLRDSTPTLREWVIESDTAELTTAYQWCVEMYTAYRRLHRFLAGQTLRGATTTGRTFTTSESNYRTFVAEMGSIVKATTRLGVAHEDLKEAGHGGG
jgi:hypothetical protein